MSYTAPRVSSARVLWTRANRSVRPVIAMVVLGTMLGVVPIAATPANACLVVGPPNLEAEQLQSLTPASIADSGTLLQAINGSRSSDSGALLGIWRDLVVLEARSREPVTSSGRVRVPTAIWGEPEVKLEPETYGLTLSNPCPALETDLGEITWRIQTERRTLAVDVSESDQVQVEQELTRLFGRPHIVERDWDGERAAFEDYVGGVNGWFRDDPEIGSIQHMPYAARSASAKVRSGNGAFLSDRYLAVLTMLFVAVGAFFVSATIRRS